MKLLVVLSCALLAASTRAFVAPAHVSRQSSRSAMLGRGRLAAEAVALEPEPEGGTELTAFTSIAGCRMKQLDEQVKLSNSENKEPAYKFWMAGQAEVCFGEYSHLASQLKAIGLGLCQGRQTDHRIARLSNTNVGFLFREN